MSSCPENLKSAYFEYLLRIADTELVLGHRLSEWCGHGPILEEDIALANIGLDSLGHAALLLTEAGLLKDPTLDQDQLVYFRDPIEFRNTLMSELPRGDFAFTILRQYFCSTFLLKIYEALGSCSLDTLKALANKLVKETRYHVRHTATWVCRLGDGTEESKSRIQSALEELLPYVSDLFLDADSDEALENEFSVVRPSQIQSAWESDIRAKLTEAMMNYPDDFQGIYYDSRAGLHTEHLGLLLAEMQSLARAHPGASW